jgi:hypothetical protein
MRNTIPPKCTNRPAYAKTLISIDFDVLSMYTVHVHSAYGHFYNIYIYVDSQSPSHFYKEKQIGDGIVLGGL